MELSRPNHELAPKERPPQRSCPVCGLIRDLVHFPPLCTIPRFLEYGILRTTPEITDDGVATRLVFGTRAKPGKIPCIECTGAILDSARAKGEI